ncbi:Sperm-associated antigen 1 [Manis javanica]|nr:sperm-associated antigen 1-like [Manis javanica]KAI5929038.1 Sperm-associated antigen 1 [Manis javanica]
MQTLNSRIHFAQRPRSRQEPRAVGNIQKKLAGKGEGGKRPERGASRRARAPGAGTDNQGRVRASATAGRALGHQGCGSGAGDPAAARAPPGTRPLCPASLKSRGNELFKNGQFALAAIKYAAAIAQLEPAGSGSADDLSILHSNKSSMLPKRRILQWMHSGL